MIMEEQELRKYEIMVLAKEDIKEELTSFLLKNKANILEISDFNKIQLSYPIKKEKFAYMGVSTFELLPSLVENLKNDLKFNNNLLRFIITKVELKGKDNKKVKSKLKEEALSLEAKKEKKSSVDSSILTNEALQEKLKEILN